MSKIVVFKTDKNLMPYQPSNKYTDKLESRDPLYQNTLYTCNVPVTENVGDIKIGETFTGVPIGEIVARIANKPELGTVSIERTLNRIFYGSNDKPGKPGMPPVKPLASYNVYYGFICADDSTDETTPASSILEQAATGMLPTDAFGNFQPFAVSTQSDLNRDLVITNDIPGQFGIPAVIIPVLFEVPNYIIGADCKTVMLESQVVDVDGVPCKIYTGFNHADTIAEFTYTVHK